MPNLALKYRPKEFSDVVEQDNVVKILEAMCEQPELPNRNFLLVGPRGCGKASTLNTQILTPSGYVRMGDIKIGQAVFTHRGNIGKVSGIYPQGKIPVYRITLQDKTYIDVSSEHLNMVWRNNCNQGKGIRQDFIVPTFELIEMFKHQTESSGKLRIDIPVLDWPAQSVPINPYLLGALIGDGSLSDRNSLAFTNSEPDVVNKVKRILQSDYGLTLKQYKDSCNYAIVDSRTKSYRYLIAFKGTEYQGISSLQNQLVDLGYPQFDFDSILKMARHEMSGPLYDKYPELFTEITLLDDSPVYHSGGLKKLHEELEELGLAVKSVEKHIPSIYLYNSKSVRLKLLQGLFDTDGYTAANPYSTEFDTSSKQLSSDFSFLVRSLGIRDTITEHESWYTNNGAKIETPYTHYNHYLKIPSDLKYCTSSKHLTRVKERQIEPVRAIESIQYIGEQECQCIMVDHPDHSYICNDGLIPTHNTTLGRIVANKINDGHGQPLELDAASNSGVDTVRQLVQKAHEYPVGSKYKVFIADECHAFSNAAWQSMLKVLEDQPAKSVFILLTTNPEKIPATILSRVQKFQLSNISLDGIVNRLKYVISQENAEGQNITYDDQALTYIAKLAKGGMRDALTLLDKALVYSNEITFEHLQISLGIPDYNDYFDLLNAYAKKDDLKIIQIVEKIYNSGTNFVKWFEEFQSFVINIVKYVYLHDITETTIPATYQNKLSTYGPKHAMICLQLSQTLVEMIAQLSKTEYMEEVADSYLMRK